MTGVSSELLDKIESYVRRGAGDVFRTMISMGLKPVVGEIPPAIGSAVVVGSVGFAGKASGVVYMGVPESLAIEAASIMVGLSSDELDDDMVNDVIAELSNMVVGFVKSQLCDAGLTSVLTVPSVVRGDHMKVQKVSQSENRSTLMSCGSHILSFEIVLKSEC